MRGMRQMTTEIIELTNDQLADLLAETQAFLDEYGWAQGEFKVVDGHYDAEKEEIIYGDVIGYCAIGGVLYSQGIEERFCCENPKVLAVSEALCRVIDIPEGLTHAENCTGINCRCTVNWVTVWNDSREKWEEIQDAFILAEKDARSGNVDE